MKHFIFASLLFLSACTTTPAPIMTNSCNPPAELMQKEDESLPPITKQTLTEAEIINLWVDETVELINSKREKNALIDHIQTHCKDNK